MHRSLLLLSLTTGCVIHVDRQTDHDRLVFDDVIEEVVYDLDAGDLHVEVRDVDAAELSRDWSWTGDRPRVDAVVEGRTLFLDVRCEGRPFRACAVDHVLTLPASAAIAGETGSGDVLIVDAVSADLSTGSGSITLRAIAGATSVEAGSGDIELDGIGGDVIVSTGSGDIFGRALASEDVWVDAGSGDVDLELVVTPRNVDVSTGTGDIRLELPAGAYDLRTSVGTGDVSVDGIDVRHDADAQVDVETGTGDITVSGR